MRALRRHHRERTFARRRRIASRSSEPEDLTYKIAHWHFRCKCFECPAERHADRRRAERQWRREWDDAVSALAGRPMSGGLVIVNRDAVAA